MRSSSSPTGSRCWSAGGSSPPERPKRSGATPASGAPTWETSLLLEVSGLETAYGASQVLFGISLDIASGEVATLLGRNGMGKTTAVRSIMGLTRARAGAIRFRGRRIEREAP